MGLAPQCVEVSPFFLMTDKGQGVLMPDGSAWHDGRDIIGGCVLNGSPLGPVHSTNNSQRE